ncbi:probable aquaporin NIP7-1 isoform X2 [Herrania umbratica]|uniref:Probable aquaporin NIP7-1 isoform X2 n=1 Tax=Herrania umbratica TaxID=108875 RepID=A0A6J1AWH2_9ROSI|nr:probable aquaporin NIP7-1 isoform X2 [Herrania umbratica]
MKSLITKMKHFFKENSLPNISNNASIRGLSGDDQEMGSSTMSGNGNILIENSGFHCFPHGKDLNLARAILAEMLGTFILMFSICGIITSTKLTGGGAALLEYATTAGLTIVVLIFSIGSISGAHVNPAVTIAFAAFGHFQWSRVLHNLLSNDEEFTFLDLMVTRPGQGCEAAFWVELIANFIVVFVLAALTHQSQSVGPVSGLVIGIAIVLAVLITGPISGGSLNPARSLGPAIVSRNFERLWIYLTAPVIGAVTGALLYGLLRLRGPAYSPSSSPDSSMLSHSLAFGRS